MVQIYNIDNESELASQLWEQSHSSNVVAVVGRPGPHISNVCAACLRHETVYVPIDSGYPEERIRYILGDCNAETVIIDSSVPEDARAVLALEYGVLVLSPSYHSSAVNLISERPPRTDLDQLLVNHEDAAYIIYTSGSTGNPKGISISRGNLFNQLSWLVSEGFLSGSTKILQKTPIGFDAAQWEILAPLAGSGVTAVGDDGYRDPNAIVNDIQKDSATTLQAVPTLLQAIVDIDGFRGLRTLTTVFSGGEALSWKLVADIRHQLPHVRIVNLYGPSECTINASAYVIDPSMELPTIRDYSVPLGIPVANTLFKVQPRETTEILPPSPSVEGELIIGGGQVGMGYINHPEETEKKFFVSGGTRYYRTGDAVRIDQYDNCVFIGRLDNQVKIRGNRVELDEISNHYQRHPWVSKAQCVLVDKPVSGKKELVACIQLSPAAAPLMDGRTAARHHMSKRSRRQVKAQLSNPGVRSFAGGEFLPIAAVADRSLMGSLEEFAFSRKTYRTFQYHKSTREELREVTELLSGERDSSVPELRKHRLEIGKDPITAILLGLSAYSDDERLLPKYAYASPGSLYSIQAYLETPNPATESGSVSYFNPLEKTLYPVCASDFHEAPRIHLVSRTEAISSVYEKNVREVQYLELGHLLGLVQDVLQGSGSFARFTAHEEDTPPFVENEGDLYLGTIEIVDEFTQNAESSFLLTPSLFFSVPESSSEIESGTYVVDASHELNRVSSDFIECSDVIAINQSVYRQASYGIGLYFDHPVTDLDSSYASLGAALHKLQSTCIQTGFMSSGYSSFTGSPLPSALHAAQLLNFHGPIEQFSFYFALAGLVTQDQRKHRGMNEDRVHMAGPAEIVTREMKKLVPAYMVPDRTVILSELPTTPNGKVDVKTLKKLHEVSGQSETGVGRAPAGTTENIICNTWSRVLKNSNISAEDNFFDLGGDSIRVMMALSEHRRDFGDTVSPQLLFSNPILEDFAAAVEDKHEISRLVQLAPSASNSADETTAVMWPGLGGLPLNLSSLAERLTSVHQVFGVQASGINPGEIVSTEIEEMARGDIYLLPAGRDYHLVGYSFGCRIAYTAASLLQDRGIAVRSLTLICPGNPTLSASGEIPQTGVRVSDMRNPEFLGMLLSVFNSPLNLDEFQDAWRQVFSLEDAIRFIHDRYPSFGYDQVARISNLVATHYQFDYTFDELGKVYVDCPILLIKAAGDQYSSVDSMLASNPVEFETEMLAGDHYEILKPPYVEELMEIINRFQSSVLQTS